MRLLCMEYFGEPTQAILEFFAASVDRLVCYTAVFSGEERCVTTLRTAVYQTMNRPAAFFQRFPHLGEQCNIFLSLLYSSTASE